ncbi:MAG: VWA domain-containing protein [Bacteroidales bacterium]|nr:VWA domain-containing protein [Bacteroidales bacterium]
MINLAQPQYLLLILAIPFIFLFYWLSLRIKRKRISKIGDPSLVDKLIPDVSKGRGWLKVTFFSLAFLFFAVGLARPQLGARLKEKESNGVEIMIALDVSNSMLAEDYSPNRMERAKLAISRLVDKLQGDRIGLVIFAGESFIQLPITTDYVSAKIFMNNIGAGSVPIQGTALAEAITTSARSFSSQSDKSRAIILITDGEDHEGNALDAAKAAAEIGIRIYCIGVGSPEGKPVPVNGDLLKDKDGNIVVSRLDESILRSIASVGNGAYVRAGNSEFGLNPIIDNIREIEKSHLSSVVFEDFDEQYMYFFGIALFFLILEMLIAGRKTGRNIFKMEK